MLVVWFSFEVYWGLCSEVLFYVVFYLVFIRGFWWRNFVGFVCREVIEKVSNFFFGGVGRWEVGWVSLGCDLKVGMGNNICRCL